MYGKISTDLEGSKTHFGQWIVCTGDDMEHCTKHTDDVPGKK